MVTESQYYIFSAASRLLGRQVAELRLFLLRDDRLAISVLQLRSGPGRNGRRHWASVRSLDSLILVVTTTAMGAQSAKMTLWSVFGRCMRRFKLNAAPSFAFAIEP